jgi:hypothetical protein
VLFADPPSAGKWADAQATSDRQTIPDERVDRETSGRAVAAPAGESPTHKWAVYEEVSRVEAQMTASNTDSTALTSSFGIGSEYWHPAA